jgi:hypothetical protein
MAVAALAIAAAIPVGGAAAATTGHGAAGASFDGAVEVATATTSSGTPPVSTATARSGALALTALKVSPSNVKPGLGQAAAAATWTITDNDAAATTVHGDLYIRMQGTKAGTYIGMAYRIPFSFPDPCSGYCGATSSGTTADSTYRTVFYVPIYAATKTATWVVSEINASDDHGNTLTTQDNALARFSRSVTSTGQIDSTAPQPPYLELQSSAYLYDGDGPAVEHYLVTSGDAQSGFWKGSMTLAGPGGQTLTAGFDYPVTDPHGGACESAGSGIANGATCSVAVTFPAGSIGTWAITSVTETDNAGNTATYTPVNTLPVTLSDNSVLSATGFSITPNPVNAWRESQTTQLVFTAAGIRQSLTSVTVNFLGGCEQPSTATTQNPDGTYAVSLVMDSFAGSPSCPVTGIRMVDGAGDTALYGPDYHAPDPGLTVLNAPDVPATVTAAHLSPDTITESQIGQTLLELVVTVSVPVVPLSDVETAIYDNNGQSLTNTTGGLWTPAGGGTVDLSISAPWNAPPGTYTVGFTLTDYAGLTVTYGGPGGQPLPDGPLTFTITA